MDEQDELDLRAAEKRLNDQADRRQAIEDRLLLCEQILHTMQVAGLIG